MARNKPNKPVEEAVEEVVPEPAEETTEVAELVEEEPEPVEENPRPATVKPTTTATVRRDVEYAAGELVHLVHPSGSRVTADGELANALIRSGYTVE